MQDQHARMLLTELIDNAVQFKKENEDGDSEYKGEISLDSPPNQFTTFYIKIAP